jgi:asparagine synthase (glutamine-hydrolysing)
MCGILAVKLTNDETNINEMIKSNEILNNRGPDSNTLYNLDNNYIYFSRLAILDTTEIGNQPFIVNNDILVCNGEIFNYKELISKYDLQCKSLSDCECIIHLYQKIGFELMIKELIGDFAIVLFTKNKVFFGRDRIGVRPLFYGFTKNGSFCLSSLARVLTNYCDNIEHVKPGWGEYDFIDKNITFFKYDNQNPRIYVDNLEEKIKETLTIAVKDRLMSERPIGCLLSGGLDSSLITSILCKLLGPENVRTYSIGMTGSIDLKNAKIVADFLGTNHTEIIFTPEEGFNAIPYVIRDLESYDITTIRASVGMWLLAKYISENTKDIVIYSGEGADEVFCGYLYFHYAPSLKELGEESKRLIKDLYLYDVLRADRCVSSHGLELRVPFLDKRLTELIQSCDEEQIAPTNGIEKYILRNSFKNDKLLPNNILFRRKDGMSDGISGNSGKKWFEQIQEFVDVEITDNEYLPFINKFNNKEAYYYKKIFDNIFPKYQPVFEYWMPKWINCDGNPSGRILDVFDKKY